MTRSLKAFSRLLDERDGAVAVIVAIVALPMLLAVGAAIDFARAYNVRTNLQSAADSAVLAAASKYEKNMPKSKIARTIASYLSANVESKGAVAGEPEVSDDRTELCIDVANSVPTTFMQLARIETVPVSVRSCALLPGIRQVEIALVVDVSSSMIEEDRFEPMLNAVSAFIDAFSSDEAMKGKTKISLVPFSSRVSIGMDNTDWLKAYNGTPAVPERWTNPKAYYENGKLARWVDGSTPVVDTSKNYYWMGCIEPRADVEVKEKGSVGSLGASDVSPKTSAFVPQDANSQSGKSYCPPPITSLTDDFTYLQKAVSNLTSQGSTRLDAGVVAGWYTLSPRWKGVWEDESTPVDYDDSVQKVMVSMTDGQMNAKKTTDKFDWLCLHTSSEAACNDRALDVMQDSCSAMKKNGIEIFTLSYSNEADVKNIRKCATSTNHFYTASPSTIEAVYQTIASVIGADAVRLTQ
ncbi:vWA domain-containing protein [Sinorhizobium saheli]|uniref:VWFA domain-containing protein n=1 Tax=Sinorhizobium saheli TaxID=36856 RepID=A0A178YCR2_SINSA|nr:vWA domain-containing protein [Sinorhizobium saheli]MQW90654.1 hypothetical protein [Sinorhizobium saheli]OAP44575.1 hypothetical protein ATB98_16970 [Sinorhizobium saheli]